MPSKSPHSWLAAYLSVGLAWGCSFLFIKLSLGFLAPFGVAFGRCSLGALTLYVALLVSRKHLPKGRDTWWHLWIIALLMNVIPGILFAIAETRTTSILAGIINAMTPLTTLFFMVFVFRDEPTSRRELWGLFIGFMGVLVVLGAWQGLGKNPWWAVGALLLSVTLYGIAFPYTRRHISPRGIPPVSLASAQLLLASITLLPFAVIRGTNGHEVTLKATLAILALGIFGSGLAFMWNFRVIAMAGSSIASTVTYMTPVVAVVVGMIFLNESLSWFEPVGGLIVLLGAAVGQGRFAKRH